LQTTKTKPKTAKDQIRQIIKRPKEKFLTPSQEEYWEILGKNQITICTGPSGTGKSYISIKKAIDLLWDEDNKYEKIVIIKPAVEAEDRTIGSLPGTIEEKMLPYVFPSYCLIDKIIGKEAREKLKALGIIQDLSLNFLRGYNADNVILIFEECQNASPNQMKLLLTRIGFNSKIFMSGDIEQSDKFKDKTKSGLFDVKKRLSDMNDIGIFEFTINDIVRNPIISEILKRYDT